MNIQFRSQSATKYSQKSLYTVYTLWSPKAGESNGSNKDVYSSFEKCNVNA